jgi:uncharacterized protein (TIRG00374 family)
MSLAVPPAAARRLRIRWYHALWIAAPVLLALALRGVPLDSVVQVLRRLTIGQIAILVLVNLVILQVFAARWAIITAGFGYPVSPISLVAYRTAGFSISYFTPGTQFGGEPLQAFLLHRRASVPLAPAAASVAIDKALELLGNFTFLAFGIVLSAQTSLLSGLSALPLLAVALLILALPLLFVVAASHGARPLTILTRWVRSRWLPRSARMQRLEDAAAHMEEHIVRFLGEHPARLLLAMGLSLLSWIFMVGEIWLALQFLGLPFSAIEVIAIITATRLAFLRPLPGGIGALEAGLVLAFQALGHAPAEALALSALIRARDLAIGVGLVLAVWLPANRPGAATILKKASLCYIVILRCSGTSGLLQKKPAEQARHV